MSKYADLAQRVINGTYGGLWWNGILLAETFKFQAFIEEKKQPVEICGDLWEHEKTTSLKGKGNLGIHKVDSSMVKEYLSNGKNGKFPKATIISNLDDPDSYGNERVVVKNVSLDGMTIADWQHGVLGKMEKSFTYSGWPELIDEVTR